MASRCDVVTDVGLRRLVPPGRAGSGVNERDAALWWARIRSGGPQRVSAGGPTPAGLRRLVEADARAVWLIPNLPDSAGPAVLAEYGVPGSSMLDSKGTLRVFAACVRCC